MEWGHDVKATNNDIVCITFSFSMGVGTNLLWARCLRELGVVSMGVPSGAERQRYWYNSTIF